MGAELTKQAATDLAMCVKKTEEERGSIASSSPLPWPASVPSLPPSLVHPILFFFSHPLCSVPTGNWPDADGERTAGNGQSGRMRRKERGNEWRENSVIHANCVYCLRPLLPSLYLSFISFHRGGVGNSIKGEGEGESLAVMIGSERCVPFFGTKEPQLFPAATTAEKQLVIHV